MTTTATQENFIFNPRLPLSSFAQFHSVFQGKTFINTKTNKPIPKFRVYWSDKKSGDLMARTETPQPPFRVIETPVCNNGY